MATKKFGLTASTPAVRNPTTFNGNNDTSAPSSIEESSTFVIRTVTFSDESSANTNIVPTKQTTLELMCKAIEVVGAPRKGASYVAILKWITSNKENAAIGQLKAILKKTILKALETGLLKRANATKNSKGVIGSFLLNRDSLNKEVKTKAKNKVAPKKKKVDIEVNSSESSTDTEVIKKPRRKKVEKLKKTTDEVVDQKKVAPNSKQNGVKNILPPSKVKNKKTTSVAATKEKTKAESGAKVKTMAGSAPKAKAASGPKVNAKTGSAPKAKVETGPKAKTMAGSAPKAKGVSGQKVKMTTGSAPKAKDVTGANVKTTVGSSPKKKTTVVPVKTVKRKKTLMDITNLFPIEEDNSD